LNLCLAQRVAALFLIVSLLAVPLSAKKRACRPHATPASHSFPLRSFGYRAANLEPELPLGKRHNRVGFVDKDTLAISFQLPSDQPRLSTRQMPSSYFLRLVLVDLTEGKETVSTTWPGRVYSSGVHVLADGNLLLTGSEKLTLYSRELKLLAQIPLSGENVEITPSTSGKTLWMAYVESGHHVLEMRSARDLSSMGEWPEEKPAAGWSASDAAIVTRVDRGQVQILKKSPSSAWNRIFGDYGCYPGTPSYVSEDRIVFLSCQELLFMNTNGGIVDREPLLRGERMDAQTETAQSGEIAAISLRRGQGSRRLFVYDVAGGRAAGSVAVNLPQRWHYSYAVSPGGTRIAVLADGVVNVYSVSSLACGN
jgi:hypothetical protein